MRVSRFQGRGQGRPFRGDLEAGVSEPGPVVERHPHPSQRAPSSPSLQDPRFLSRNTCWPPRPPPWERLPFLHPQEDLWVLRKLTATWRAHISTCRCRIFVPKGVYKSPERETNPAGAVKQEGEGEGGGGQGRGRRGTGEGRRGRRGREEEERGGKGREEGECGGEGGGRGRRRKG